MPGETMSVAQIQARVLKAAAVGVNASAKKLVTAMKAETPEQSSALVRSERATAAKREGAGVVAKVAATDWKATIVHERYAEHAKGDEKFVERAATAHPPVHRAAVVTALREGL